MGDFASGAVDKLGSDDLFIVLFEYDPASADTALFKSEGHPEARSTADDFSPERHAARHPRPGRRAEVLQRPGSRVLPLRGPRLVRSPRRVVPQVNEVLATLTVEPLGAPGTTTTTPPSTTTPGADLDHRDDHRRVADDHAPATDAPADTTPTGP